MNSPPQTSLLLRAIAISAGILQQDSYARHEAYDFLQRFQRDASSTTSDPASIRLCLQILLAPAAPHKNQNSFNNNISSGSSSSTSSSSDIINIHSTGGLLVVDNVDVTASAKLFVLLVIRKYVQLQYASLSMVDAQMLRSAIVEAAKLTALESAENWSEMKLIGSKLSELLSDLASRDFPQRWTNFWDELYNQVWVADLNVTDSTCAGAQICMDCISVLTEDCTDSDFNSKISTTRRNDVLQGLNEVSASGMLPAIYSLLGHQYGLLCSANTTIAAMEDFLKRESRQPTTIEQQQYTFETRKRDTSARVVEVALTTLQKFCLYMPLDWILAQKPEYDFISVFLHLLREDTKNIKVSATCCLDALAHRKLESDQWYRLVTALPVAVSEANQVASSKPVNNPQQLLIDNLPFHRALSKMLAYLLQNHIAFVTTDKHVLKGSGEKFEAVNSYLNLLTEILTHPSGIVCSEQINMWTALLRDPQVPKTDVLTVSVSRLIPIFMNHVVKIRWEDVENGLQQLSGVIEESWDDEDEYEVWLSELRSKCTGLFRSAASCEPEIVGSYVCEKMMHLLETHGNGEPRNHVDKSTNRLTQTSDAVIKFEGIAAPFEYILQGLPKWAVSGGNDLTQKQIQTQLKLKSKLSQLANTIISWDPSDVWLKLRRANMLGSLRYFWERDPSTLPNGVDALLCYLCTNDEWSTANEVNEETLSMEVVSLRKRTGTCIVQVSKQVPHLLVQWLSQLSDRARQLLSSDLLLPPNRMHLFEFLSCVASAVEDPSNRSAFVADVLSSSLDILESREARDALSSTDNFMVSLGISQALSNPSSVTDEEHVKLITRNFARLYSSFNQLLSVGRRCHEAALKRPSGGIPLQHIPNSIKARIQSAGNEFQHFPDEGTVSISDLAIDDPFVPLWPRILPSLLEALDVVLKLWHPEYQASLLSNQIQRYVFAITDDDVYLTMKQDSLSGGGVFGKGGTAGTVISGCDRRSLNLVPRWSSWFNELRNVCFQLLGLMSIQRVLYAPEIAPFYPRLVAIVSNQKHLMSMEHRQISQFLKQFIEPLLLSCPLTLYRSHLSPIISPIIDHMQSRLHFTWSPILNNIQGITTPLTSQTCSSISALALQGGEEWFKTYYARGGLFVGDADNVTAESAVERVRVDLTRVYIDVIQAAFALKGDWALVLANISKEEQASKNPTKATTRPKSVFGLNDDFEKLNANGTRRNANQDALEARQLARINALCNYLIVEDSGIAGNLIPTIINCIGYPDAYSSRRCLKMSHRILETAVSYPQFTDLLARQLFSEIVKSLVTEPKWMVGMEWDMISLVRDIYCRISLGQWLLPGGQGASMQQSRDSSNTHMYEQSKAVSKPLQGGGILCYPSDIPRQILADLPGIGIHLIQKLDRSMSEKLAAKLQKDLLRDLLRLAADNLKQREGSTVNDDGLFSRADKEESVLNQKLRVALVPAIPEKLTTLSKTIKHEERLHRRSATDLIGGANLGALFD